MSDKTPNVPLRAPFAKDILAKISEPREKKTQPMSQEDMDKEQDRTLKNKWASWFVWILIVQLALMNIVFMLVGLGLLEFSDISLNVFMGGTLAEVFGVIIVITRNLFPNRK